MFFFVRPPEEDIHCVAAYWQNGRSCPRHCSMKLRQIVPNRWFFKCHYPALCRPLSCAQHQARRASRTGCPVQGRHDRRATVLKGGRLQLARRGPFLVYGWMRTLPRRRFACSTIGGCRVVSAILGYPGQVQQSLSKKSLHRVSPTRCVAARLTAANLGDKARFLNPRLSSRRVWWRRRRYLPLRG